MVGRFKVVTICGSSRFGNEVLEAGRRLTLEGNIVLMPGVFGGRAGDSPGVKDMLDNMCLREIDLSDEVYVVDPGGYIGRGTAAAIAYAQLHGRPVRYMVAPSGSEEPF